MKNLTFSVLMALLVLTSGAAFAQIIPPGPTTQQEPDLNNNNLPNPGNPVAAPEAQKPLQEKGTVEGTATESINEATGDQTTTGTTTTGTGTTSTDLDTTTTTTTTTGTSNLNDTDTLPSTASKLPLVGLIGLLAFGAALVVRRF